MGPKRVVLMYISEVSGHHSATLALEAAIKILSPQAQTLNINTFHYTNPISEKIVNRIYMGVIQNTPQIWNYLYDNPHIVKKITKLKEGINKINSSKLKILFDEFRPDVVVCTQAFPCGMVADFKKRYDSSLRLIAVLTDYIPHSYWIYDTIDYYVCPSEEVAGRLIEKAVAPEKIKPLGIPIDPCFSQPLSKNQLLQKLGLNPALPVVLIMGGGQGLGPIKTIVNSLEKLPGEFQEIVVCGINSRLYNYLIKRINRFKKKVLVFGYVNNIHELMSICDIIITKPGGITTAEALAKRLAMIIVDPIPGQEASNTAYLIEKHAALKVDDPRDIGAAVEDLLSNRDKLGDLKESAGLISNPRASFDIAKLILE